MESEFHDRITRDHFAENTYEARDADYPLLLALAVSSNSGLVEM
jgi:hypothetical protein